ncbi:LIM and SH3 domain protein Lasp isoform X1 [Phlebotomus argentipes]|uniref:LIM and SH3 domain protein Lasp isoform X1 n=1 Tax=Phlebotomus argentipes TaxID=94469 RepID=UPI002893435C|nr:LIM and SH3 domain protein Lasp isoform X1 [Phlebotomus argentipes]
MNKSCARCSKIVYPIEELKCLDKSWHKACFKCHECGMTLNMKTYKGFNKLPYCEAHIPKAKATTIADTPELKRIAENTKIQSNVQYHAEFEKLKGKVTQVADDPETLRIKQNTMHISNVAYHGDLEKKAAMEKQREAAEVSDTYTRDNNDSEYFSEQLAAESLSQYQAPAKQPPPPQAHHQANHHHNQSQPSHVSYQQAQGKTAPQYGAPPAPQYTNNSSVSAVPAGQQLQLQQQQPYGQQPGYNNRTNVVHSSSHPSGGLIHAHQQQQQINQKYYDQYENYARPASYSNNNQSAGYNSQMVAGYGNSYHHPPAQHTPAYTQNAYAQNNHYSQMGGGFNNATAAGIGKIADYDPLTDGPRNVPNTQRPSSTLIYSSDRNSVNSTQGRRIGSVADMDPANGVFGAAVEQQQNHMYQQQQQHNQMRHSQAQQQPQRAGKMRVFRALYDYEAQDTDEVSFAEGDVIFEVDSIDAGWMTGRVERTGKVGMLPANYVELATI